MELCSGWLGKQEVSESPKHALSPKTGLNALIFSFWNLIENKMFLILGLFTYRCLYFLSSVETRYPPTHFFITPFFFYAKTHFSQTSYKRQPCVYPSSPFTIYYSFSTLSKNSFSEVHIIWYNVNLLLTFLRHWRLRHSAEPNYPTCCLQNFFTFYSSKLPSDIWHLWPHPGADETSLCSVSGLKLQGISLYWGWIPFWFSHSLSPIPSRL